MSIKAEVTKALHNAQRFFKEPVTPIAKSVKRDALENMLMLYVTRFRQENDPEPSFSIKDCHACGSTGVYKFADGRTGHCFRCKGKGFQDEADQKRNYGFDLHHPAPAPVEELDEAQKAQTDFDEEQTAKPVQQQLPIEDEDDIPF